MIIRLPLLEALAFNEATGDEKFDKMMAKVTDPKNFPKKTPSKAAIKTFLKATAPKHDDEVVKMSPLSFLKKIMMPKIKEAIGAKSVVEAIPSHLNLQKDHEASMRLWQVIDGEERKKLSKFSESSTDREGYRYTWEVTIQECRGVKIAEIYLIGGTDDEPTFVLSRADIDKFKS